MHSHQHATVLRRTEPYELTAWSAASKASSPLWKWVMAPSNRPKWWSVFAPEAKPDWIDSATAKAREPLAHSRHLFVHPNLDHVVLPALGSNRPRLLVFNLADLG